MNLKCRKQILAGPQAKRRIWLRALALVLLSGAWAAPVPEGWTASNPGQTESKTRATPPSAKSNAAGKGLRPIRPATPPGPPESDGYLAAESRVVTYIRENVEPGQPLLVSELYNRVFVEPQEHLVLDKFYNAFFRIPLFLATYQQQFGKPPTLEEISQQFDLKAPGAADAILRVMECDPRVPRFFHRNPKTGELTDVDVVAVRNNPNFTRDVSPRLGGWEGNLSPGFVLLDLQGKLVDSQKLGANAVLLYVWFTGCPPCMKEAPELVRLKHERGRQGLVVVGANADRLLGLPYDDEVRKRYVQEEKIDFPVVYWNKDADLAFRQITIYPTMFLIDKKGTIVHQWIGFVDFAELDHAVSDLLGPAPPARVGRPKPLGASPRQTNGRENNGGKGSTRAQ